MALKLSSFEKLTQLDRAALLLRQQQQPKLRANQPIKF